LDARGVATELEFVVLSAPAKCNTGGGRWLLLEQRESKIIFIDQTTGTAAVAKN
jgi:hypothetical protein